MDVVVVVVRYVYYNLLESEEIVKCNGVTVSALLCTVTAPETQREPTKRLTRMSQRERENTCTFYAHGWKLVRPVWYGMVLATLLICYAYAYAASFVEHLQKGNAIEEVL